MKNFRKPYWAIFLALLVLLISCEKYEYYDDRDTNSLFEYDIYNHFIESQELLSQTISSVENLRESEIKIISSQILQFLNTELGTNLVIPEGYLDLINQDREFILESSLEEGWLNETDIRLNDLFLQDIISSDFNTALNNFEERVFELNLSQDDFNKQVQFANMIKSINDIDPELFRVSATSRGGWACAGAVLALTAATAGLASCATIAACGFAILLHLAAIDGVARKCGDIFDVE